MRILFLLLIMAGVSFGEIFATVDSAIKSAKENKKPILLLVTKEGCSACGKLFMQIQNSYELKMALSEYNLVIKDINALDERNDPVAVRTPTFFFMNTKRNLLTQPLEGTTERASDLSLYLFKIAILYKESMKKKSSSLRQ